jgi:two-component system cell cycle sensor histidine kinase/response regulator CckA
MSGWRLLLILLLSSAAAAAEPARQQVLCLHSYHPADWTDAIMRGYRQVLGARPDLDLAVEYMDTKRREDPAYLDLLAELYRRRYGSTRFALVLTSDDHAYTFATRRRAELFGDAPVVFCGVNRWQEVAAARPPGVVGVAEQVDWAGTLAAARAARPRARTIHVICDDTETGRKNLAELQLAAAALPGLAVDVPAGLDLRALGAHLTGLPREDFAVFIAYWREPDGRTVSPDELAAAMRASAAPVFGRSEWAIGRGMAGGWCVSGERQGRAAATLASAVLGGARIDDLPLVTDSPNVPLFDWVELDHHGIDLALLPPGSEILNRPETALHIPRPLAALAAACGGLLLALVAVLAVLMRQRRRALAGAAAAAANLRTILQSMGDGVIATDGDGRVTTLNPVAERLTGWPEAEAAGRPIAEIFRPVAAGDRRPLEVPALTAMRTGSAQHLSNHALLLARDGRELHIADSGAPMRDPAGRIVGAVLVFRDVSERHALEDRLRKAQTLEALGRMAGGISHDFNNMLTAILGNAQLLLPRCAADERSTYLAEQIQAAAERAAELTRRLLTLGRRTPATTGCCDLHQSLASVAALIEHALPRSIAISIEPGASQAWIGTDRATIENAVLNLGLNARDAMPAGGSLRIATADLDHPPPGADGQPLGWLRLTVADTGAGMDEEVLRRVFEPFFTTKALGKGTGLGLAMVHAAVSELGGQVRIESTPGCGTTVILYLPRRAAPLPAQAPAAGHNPVLRTGCVLLADDEATALAVARATLEADGHQVLTARDGAEAVEVFVRAQGRIQVLVLDMIMPRQDGRGCLAAIRALKPGIPAILVSGYIGDPAAAQGFDILVAKPYRLDELRQAVARLLARD